MLRADFHQEFYADAGHTVGERVFADDLGQVFAVGGTGIIGVRHDEEQADADFVAGLRGVEIDAGAGNADAAAHIIEMLDAGIRGTDAHELGDFAAATAAALGSCAVDRGIWRSFVHCVLDRHDLLARAETVG